MLQCNGFSAWISVDGGVEVPQHGVETDETGNKVNCWIESKDGQPFAVKWRNDFCSVPTGGYIELDGIDVGGKGSSKSGNREPTSFEKVVVSSTSVRQVMFSSLTLTDDDLYLSAEASKNIGEIKLSIWEEDNVKPSFTCDKDLPHDYKIHERTKKGLAHRVKFGDMEVTPPQSMTRATLVKRIATFVFWYRSLDILRAKGIVSNDKVGSSIAKRKLDESDLVKDESEQEDEDEDEIKALEDKLKALKERRGKANLKRIKLENVPVFKPGEIIDLT